MDYFPPSPKSPETTRRKILAASFEEFYKNGFQGQSLNHILEIAGAARGGGAMETKATKEKKGGIFRRLCQAPSGNWPAKNF